jgi:hypothetical protein
LIDAIQGYIWDQKASDQGEDKPLKKKDHINDSLRYLVASVFKTGIIEAIDNDLTVEQARRQIYGDQQGLWGDGMQGGYV